MFEENVNATYVLRREAALDRMKGLKLTYSDVARVALCTPTYIGKLVNGQRSASAQLAKRVCQALVVVDPATLWEPGNAPEGDPLAADDDGTTKGEAETMAHTLKSSGTAWTPEDDAYINQHWGKMRHRDVAAHLGRSVGACEQRRYKMVDEARKQREASQEAERRELVVSTTSSDVTIPAMKVEVAKVGGGALPSGPQKEETVEIRAGHNTAVNGTGLPLPAPAGAGLDPVERELAAMLAVHRCLTGLEPTERQNVVSWVLDRYTK